MLVSIRKFSRNNPLITAIGIILVMVVTSLCLRPVFNLIPEGTIKDLCTQLWPILRAYVIVLLLGFRWCYKHGNALKTFLAVLPHFLLYAVMLVVILVNVMGDSSIEWKPAVSILIGILTLFRIGFAEESLFRGIVANAFGLKYAKDAKGVWLTVISSGLVFGFMHITNILSGVTFMSALSQSIIASLLGMFLTAAYCRGGNLWIMILVHAVTDSLGLFQSLFTTTGTDVEAINQISISGNTLILLVIYLALTIIILRNSKIPEVIENFQKAAVLDKKTNKGI